MHGRPPPPATTDPYELALAENVGYLVDDTRRAATLAALKGRVGIDPATLLATPAARIAAAIEGGGMRPLDRAEKIKRCAALASEVGLDRLRKRVAAGGAEARKVLKKFPGFGDPGCDRALLFAKALPTLAPDSNALRVLLRIGFGVDAPDYSRTYRSVAEATAPELPARYGDLIAAHALLRIHGQEVCKRAAPRCEVCPLSDGSCAFHAKSDTLAAPRLRRGP